MILQNIEVLGMRRLDLWTLFPPLFFKVLLSSLATHSDAFVFGGALLTIGYCRVRLRVLLSLDIWV